MSRIIDLTTPSAGIAIVTILDVLCLVAIVACYIFHPDPNLIKFLDGAFTGFNGALLMAVRVSGTTNTNTTTVDSTKTNVLTTTPPVK